MRIHHLAIQVPHLDDAHEFYAGVLGLAVLRRQQHAIWVDADGAILMLEQCSAAAESDGPDVQDRAWMRATPGLFVLALAIDPGARSQWRARLMAAGVTIDHESAFSLYFRDPWGARLALSHHPTPAL
jgi:catechol 2,3-dioxygenase-like lactoylglutathione lyase family enzyme